jgi:hypothetical protein
MSNLNGIDDLPLNFAHYTYNYNSVLPFSYHQQQQQQQQQQQEER